MAQTDEPTIRRARKEDVGPILELAAKYRLGKIAPPVTGEAGFLVSDFGREEYLRFVERADHFYVLQDEKKVLGFVLAYSSELIEDDEFVNKQIKLRCKDRFILIKQICVRLDLAGRGLGHRLYEYVFGDTPNVPFFAAIVVEPQNTRSIRFHKNLGFRKDFEITPPDGMPRGVWKREAYCQDLLRRQYQIAMDLYKHEDLLNWNKLNNFFYVTTGLLAILGLVLKGNVGGDKEVIFYCVIAIVGFLGCVMSGAFWGVLYSGVRYMHNRKDTVMEIEQILMKHGAKDLVSNVNLPEEERKLFKRALTAKILRKLPLFMMLVWSVVLVFAIYKLSMLRVYGPERKADRIADQVVQKK